MIDFRQKRFIQRRTVEGRGLVNSTINNLPFEAHLPGYQYCGPGTKLTKRISRGDLGINPLDSACKEHDISYNKFKDIDNRHIADKILIEKAWQRVKSKDANLSERAAALLVTNIMKAKTKFGMGVKTKPKNNTFCCGLKKIKNKLRKLKTKDVSEAIKYAVKSAKKEMKHVKPIIAPRIIPLPKSGGILPFLIPLFAGLSAIGSLAGGAAAIAKTVEQVKNANKQLKETSRHNETMESIALGKGMYLKPYKTGLGLYLHPKN